MTDARLVSAVVGVLACLAAAEGCARDPARTVREYVRSGDRYVESEKYPEAVIEFRNAVKIDPASGDVRLKLAETYERLGDTWKALPEYVQAAALLPDNVSVQIKAANMLLLVGRFDEAKARADRALAVAPNSVEALIAKGNALAGLKYLDAAVAEIENAIRVSPERSASYASLGAFEIARGNRDQAERAFARAIETSPTSVRARLALAHFYWGTGNVPAAERELIAALAVDPADVPAHRALAVFYLATHRASMAEPHLRTVVEGSAQGGGRLVLGFVLADHYVSTGRSDDAKALLRKLGQADAQGYSEATIRLAALAARSGDTAGAHTLIDDVLLHQPDNISALVARADLLLGAGKDVEALAGAQEAVRKGPHSASAYFALARLHGVQRNWDAAAAAYSKALELDPGLNAARLALARLWLQRGKPDDAIRLAYNALRVQPGVAGATMILARALLSKGDAENAAPHVMQLVKAFPESADTQTALGQLRALQGERRDARSAFDRALRIDPGILEAFAGITTLDLQANDPAAARARVDARLAESPSDPRLLLLAARLYVVLRDTSAAERTLRRVIEVDPAQIEAYALLGQVYASEHRLDEARAEFERLAMLGPSASAVGAQTVLGIILQMQNKWAEAQARYERVLVLDPTAAVAANNLAWIYAERSTNLEKALTLAETARSQLPDSPEVSDTLGWVYYKSGLTSLAVPTLRASVDKAPTNAVYRYHLGLAYAQSGNTKASRQALEQALALNAQFEGSADARRVLAGSR